MDENPQVGVKVTTPDDTAFHCDASEFAVLDEHLFIYRTAPTGRAVAVYAPGHWSHAEVVVQK